MFDKVESVIELLQTAYAEKDWELVIESIQLLNEIPNGMPADFGDEEFDYE